MTFVAVGPTQEAAITTAPAALEDAMNLVDDVSMTFVGKALGTRYYRVENLSPHVLLYRLASAMPGAQSKAHRLQSGGSIVFAVQPPGQTTSRVKFWCWHAAGTGVELSALVTELA